MSRRPYWKRKKSNRGIDDGFGRNVGVTAAQVDEKIAERARQAEPGKALSATHILMTAPGVSRSSGLTLASRIGPVKRFPSPRGLAPRRLEFSHPDSFA